MKKRPGNPMGAPLLFVCHLGLFSFCILTCHFDFLYLIFTITFVLPVFLTAAVTSRVIASPDSSGRGNLQD
jgi:hypothetical protein